MNVQQWLDKSWNKTCFALITGASSGIGYEYLRALAAAGCNCIATSIDERELLAAARTVRDEFRVEVIEVIADLSCESGVESLLGVCDQYEVAILVNNAGFGVKGEFVSHSAQLYTKLVFLNALAPTLICRHILPMMIRAERGLILHVASINAVTPIAYNAVYTATKAFLLYYSYAVAYECRNTQLLFQVVFPGTTNTPFHKRQGAVPHAMFMEPSVVVKRSLAHVDQLLSISNRLDRILFPIVSALPLWIRVRIGTALLKYRLKIGGGGPVPESVNGM